MAIDNVRLPIDVERGVRGGPSFRTTIVSLANGDENRNQEWETRRGAWNIGYGIQKREDMEEIYNFFHARRGMAYGFRFRDWMDYSVKEGPTLEVIGQPAKRQLARLHDDVIRPYTRVVRYPVADTLKVFVDYVLTEAYTLDALGVLTFTGGDPGDNVLTTFEYDIPVRFDTDTLEVELNTFREGRAPSIPIVELLK